jgi:hypothetical protein
METPAEKYIREHSTPQSEALKWLERQTNIRTNYPIMLSGAVQGRLLTMLVQLTKAERVLEIGTFTGYSAICMAYGLPDSGHIDTLELNDELEDLIVEGFERAGVADKIKLHIGDAIQTLQDMEGCSYDMAFIDANKREYCDYYNYSIDLVKPGGLIVADDTLWSGKLFEETVPKDKQTQGIARFNDLVASDSRVETVVLPIRNGLTLIRKK